MVRTRTPSSWRIDACSTTSSSPCAARLSTTTDAHCARAVASRGRCGGRLVETAAVTASDATTVPLRSGARRSSRSRSSTSSGSATTTTRSRASARERPSPAIAAHSMYQGTSTIALPNTTKRGSSSSPTASCTSEIATAAVSVAPTALQNAARRVRGCSGRPNPYAVSTSNSTYANDHAKRDEPDHEYSCATAWVLLRPTTAANVPTETAKRAKRLTPIPSTAAGFGLSRNPASHGHAKRYLTTLSGSSGRTRRCWVSARVNPPMAAGAATPPGTRSASSRSPASCTMRTARRS